LIPKNACPFKGRGNAHDTKGETFSRLGATA
jgi:hypothetical protein